MALGLSSAAAAQNVVPQPPPCAFPGFGGATSAVGHRARTLTVLPLTVVGNESEQTDFLATGLPDAIINKLSAALPRLEIAGRRVTYAHAVNNTTTAKKAGAELETKYLLTGAVSGSREGAKVSIALYDAAGGARI